MTNSEPQPEHSFNDLLAGLLANKPLRAAFFSDHLLPVEDFREKHLPVVTAWAEETGKAIDRATAARLARRVWMGPVF